MNNSAGEIEKAALDARVNLTAEEKERVLQNCHAVMEQLDKIGDEALKEVPAAFYGHSQPGMIREDKQKDSLPLETVLQNAADADEYCFHVPRIVEE